MGGSHAQNVGVLLPSLENREQILYLSLEFLQTESLITLFSLELLHLLLKQGFLLQHLPLNLLLRINGTLPDLIQFNEMFLDEFFLPVTLELCDFASEFEIEGDHVLVFLADGLLVAGQFVHLVQVTQFVGECL